jgi:hypothetical protein
MAFAILKLSYSGPGDSQGVVGGVCGTGFLLGHPRLAVTAHHVLNPATFKPNAGFQRAMVWLISRSGTIRRIREDATSLHPDLDLTVIRVEGPALGEIHEPSEALLTQGLEVSGLGHVGEAMPPLDASWQGTELLIRSANLASVTRDAKGSVRQVLPLAISAGDVNMDGVRGLELSFGSRRGMSGGPVIDSRNRVVGMMSYGLPRNVPEKTQTFAVSVDEILPRLR